MPTAIFLVVLMHKIAACLKRIDTWKFHVVSDAILMLSHQRVILDLGMLLLSPRLIFNDCLYGA